MRSPHASHTRCGGSLTRYGVEMLPLRGTPCVAHDVHEWGGGLGVEDPPLNIGENNLKKKVFWKKEYLLKKYSKFESKFERNEMGPSKSADFFFQTGVMTSHLARAAKPRPFGAMRLLFYLLMIVTFPVKVF